MINIKNIKKFYKKIINDIDSFFKKKIEVIIKMDQIKPKILLIFAIFSIIINISIIFINMIGILALDIFNFILNAAYIIWGVFIILNIILNFWLCDLTTSGGRKISYWCISLCLFIATIGFFNILYFLAYNASITQELIVAFLRFVLLIGNFGVIFFNIIISILDITYKNKSIWNFNKEVEQ